MKRRALYCLILVSSLLGRLAAAEETMTLKQCFEAALTYSENVAISREEINIAKARYIQALGEVLPKINLEVSELLQDPTDNSANTNNDVGSTFTRLSRPEVRVNFTQNIFRGLQEFQAIKISKLDRKRKELLLKDAERLLFQDVAVAFLTVALTEMDIRTSEKIIGVSRSQVEDIKKQVDLGKSRQSDGTAQLADLALLEADLEKQKGDRRIAYEMLSFLTGRAPQPQISVKNPMEQANQPLEFYTAAAENRVDVQASRDASEIAKRNIKVQEGDLLPKADVSANVYPVRVGFQAGIDWDTEFRMTVPLFNGVTIGNIKEAKSLFKQSQFEAEERRRIAIHETKQNYEAFLSSRAQLTKYRRASDISAKSYQQQSSDFRLGLLDNFDVLQSQRTWFTALRQRDLAEAQLWIDWFRLLSSAGVMP